MISHDLGETWTVGEKEVYLRMEADLFHDGNPGTIVLWRFLEGAQERFDLRFSPVVGAPLLVDDQVTTMHIGWKSYFFCHLDGADYLLQ